MAESADDMLRSMGPSAKDYSNYEVLKSKFTAHFVKGVNVIYEREKFNQ